MTTKQKLQLVEDIINLESLRYNYYKIKMDQKQIKNLYEAYMKKDIETLTEQFKFLNDWVDNNFSYQSGSDQD